MRKEGGVITPPHRPCQSGADAWTSSYSKLLGLFEARCRSTLQHSDFRALLRLPTSPSCVVRRRAAIPRASWTVERLIDQSEAETARRGERECVGDADDASCHVLRRENETTRRPTLPDPPTAFEALFLLATKARARDSSRGGHCACSFARWSQRPNALIPPARPLCLCALC